MSSVSIHPPKTPVTKGSNTIAATTVPNVCKMPGPPAPFVPTPLPNIARSTLSPDGYSTTVTIEGKPVAIQGASFKSIGDVASKGTGGGLVSMNVEGPAKFIAPGSLTVQIQGKNVHLLSDLMSNNNGPSGSPPNAATMNGAVHAPLPALGSCDHAGLQKLACECNKHVNNDASQGGPCPQAPWGNAKSNPGGSDCTTLGTKKHKCCENAINKYVADHPECGFRSEVAFPEGAAKDAKDKAKEAYDEKKKGYMDRGRTEAQAIGYCRRDKVYLKAFRENGVEFIADVLQGNPPTAAYDFKFNCSPSGEISESQIEKYQTFVKKTPKMVHANGSLCNQDCG